MQSIGSHLGSDYEHKRASHYKWIVRTSPGNGSKITKKKKKGICVNYNDTLYFQINNLGDWRIGDFLGDKDLLTNGLVPLIIFEIKRIKTK